MPIIKMIAIAAATMAATPPAGMLLLFSDGGVKSARLFCALDF
jgi:hypothetical protein